MDFSQTYTNSSLGEGKCWLDFGDLIPIFKVTRGPRLLGNGLSAPYLLKDEIDFDQTCTSILLGYVKIWWPWPHFKGYMRGLDCWKMACLHPICWMNRWILTNLYIYIVETWKITLCFGDLDPTFKATLRLRLLENSLFTPCLLKEWVDFNQTCTSILLGHGNELFMFWWP